MDCCAKSRKKSSKKRCFENIFCFSTVKTRTFWVKLKAVPLKNSLLYILHNQFSKNAVFVTKIKFFPGNFHSVFLLKSIFWELLCKITKKSHPKTVFWKHFLLFDCESKNFLREIKSCPQKIVVYIYCTINFLKMLFLYQNQVFFRELPLCFSPEIFSPHHIFVNSLHLFFIADSLWYYAVPQTLVCDFCKKPYGRA